MHRRASPWDRSTHLLLRAGMPLALGAAEADIRMAEPHRRLHAVRAIDEQMPREDCQ